MSNLNQLILSFDHEQNFKNLDFYVTKSNAHVFNLINNWQKLNEKFLNIIGEKFCGKSHLINIFLEKNKGLKINSDELNNHYLKKMKFYKNIIIEDLTSNINEQLFYSLINIVEAENKSLIVTSDVSIVEMNFKLTDLKSRSKNFTLTSIENPDDDLIFALVLKNLSDRQISIDKKLIDYIIKRIDRSYSNISDFIYTIDQLSLKKKNLLILRLLKRH